MAQAYGDKIRMTKSQMEMVIPRDKQRDKNNLKYVRSKNTKKSADPFLNEKEKIVMNMWNAEVFDFFFTSQKNQVSDS